MRTMVISIFPGLTHSALKASCIDSQTTTQTKESGETKACPTSVLAVSSWLDKPKTQEAGDMMSASPYL